MKISNSSIAMAATHHETSYTYKESVTMEAAASKDLPGAILSISAEAEGRSYTESMAEYEKRQEEEAQKRRQENEAKSLRKMAEHMRPGEKNQFAMPEETDMKIKMLRQILAALRGEKLPKEELEKIRRSDGVLDLRSTAYRNQVETSFQMNASAKLAVGTNATGTTWQRITATSGFMSESESTTFASSGMVQTQDGRNISFNVEVSMSRAFMAEFNTLEAQNYIKTDPLMINLDTNIGSVSDQKFFFDLDADGKKEEISFAGKGSGFLALDQNEDGTINDGSELFGTKSGDGFKDLARYDEDGNGWIDENDSVFSRLRIWTKDSEGNDYLIDLKKADVGAIYLGNQDTQFSLKDEANRLNAEIKKTGIYLKESSGAVGTLNHVDLVV
ncbi:MAG: hypothetical protein MR355_02475 [Lachnospiraceae bacterium]|nr:hypothetical protein [Lachnospiraceae bacterium]